MNWQNIPRDDKTVKRAVVPKRGAFLFADYKQIEPRLLAYFGAKVGDTALVDAIKSGLDPYTAIVRGLYGENVTDTQRQEGKVLFLSLMYGGGVRTVQAQFDVEPAVAKKMIRKFHAAWPVVRRLQDLTQRVHAKRGYITTPWGRHLHMEEFGEHKLLNKLIQGSAADLMKASLIRIDRWRRGSLVWDEARGGVGLWVTREDYAALKGAASNVAPAYHLQGQAVSVIHDEVIVDLPPAEILTWAGALPGLMREDWLAEVVPVQIDIEIATTNWADKVAYEEWAQQTQEVAA